MADEVEVVAEMDFGLGPQALTASGEAVNLCEVCLGDGVHRLAKVTGRRGRMDGLAQVNLCRAHYQRLRRGSKAEGVVRSYGPRGSECEVDGCERGVEARGLCVAHYKALRRRERSEAI